MTGPIVYVAGVGWDAVPGTDRRLVERLGRSVPVIWVDPPQSLLSALRRGELPALVSFVDVSTGVRRLQVHGPPAMTRFGVRSLAWAWLYNGLRRCLRGLPDPVEAVVLANPEGRFPGMRARRLYYVTDDWVVGAPLMGLSRRRIARVQRLNAQAADAVAAVSLNLAEGLKSTLALEEVVVVPNGCDPAQFRDVATARSSSGSTSCEPVAGFVGQLNERLDLAMLEAVADSGVKMLLVGPRTERDPATTRRLDTLIARDNVVWEGRQPQEKLPGFFARMTVGLTPYADNDFNRASFPLKTLEYLSAGLPVVSSPSPATSWLDTSLIDIAATPEAFARRVVAQGTSAPDADLVEARLRFASRHSWQARSEVLQELTTGKIPQCLTDVAAAHPLTRLERS